MKNKSELSQEIAFLSLASKEVGSISRIALGDSSYYFISLKSPIIFFIFSSLGMPKLRLSKTNSMYLSN